VQVHPQGEKKMMGLGRGAQFQVVSAPPPEGESAPLGGEESHFYWAEEGAAFNLGGIS